MLDKAIIVAHGYLGDEKYQIRRLVLKTEIAHQAQPGQFVHLQVAGGIDPLLRRPLSIADIDKERQEFTLLYRLKGHGTQVLAKTKVGESLNLMGPLGRGFSLPAQGELVLVAGGIGVFPLLPLAKEALEHKLKVSLYWGGAEAGFFASAGLEYWQKTGIPIRFSTMDGSMGSKGDVFELLQKDFAQNKFAPANPPAVAVCGPHPMMEKVSDYFLRLGARVEVSLEERMACAVGACLGCVCTLKDESTGKLRRGKVCQEGPVFKGEEVLWDYGQ